jgi:hypothetical protein
MTTPGFFLLWRLSCVFRVAICGVEAVDGLLKAPCLLDDVRVRTETDTAGAGLTAVAAATRSLRLRGTSSTRFFCDGQTPD